MSAGTGTNSNLLDLDILLRLPNANAFATAISNQINQTIGVTTDAALLRYKEQINRQQAFVAQAEKTILQSQITAMKKGLGTKEIESVRDEFEKINEERQKAILKAAEITKQISNTQDADLKERLGMEKEALEAFAKMREAEGKKQIALLRRMEIEQSRAIKGGAMAESMTRALEDGFNDISGGNLSQFSTKFTKVVGSVLTAASAKVSQAADNRAAEGDTGGANALAGLAKGLAGLAKFALVATALVGAFAAIFAMAAMLDSKMKDMNIAILQQVSAFDLLGESGGSLADTLENIRNVTTSFGLAMRTGATAEQLNGMVNAIAKFGDGLTDFNSSHQLTDDLEEIASYARIVGEDFEGMATSFATQADRMGSSLDDVTDSFRSVLSSAIDSGFGVNRFQAAVFSATANSALYNKRLDETAGLLNLLSKSVGFEEGEQIMQETGDYYQNRGVQERFLDISTTNSGVVTEIFENELSNMIRGMAPDLQQGLNASLRQGLGALGVDAAGMDTEQLMRALQGRSSREQGSIMGGMGREQRVAANNMLDNINALEGGTEARARGLTSLGSGGAFAMRYNQGRQLIGNTRFNDMSMAQESYMEQQVGMSPQELRRMRNLEQTFEAELSDIQRVARGGGTDQELLDYQQAGYEFGDDGSVTRGGIEIKSLTDYIMSVDEGRLSDLAEEDEMVTMTRQIVENTMKFEDIIANGVTSFLAKIFPLMQWISDGIFSLVRKLTGSSGLDTMRASEEDRTTARTRLETEIETANTRIEELQAAPLISDDGFTTDFAAIAQRNAEIEGLRGGIETKTLGLGELNQMVTEADMRGFYGEYLPGSSTASQGAEEAAAAAEAARIAADPNSRSNLARANMAQNYSTDPNRPPTGAEVGAEIFFSTVFGALGIGREDVSETSEITAEEATAQTSIQEDQLSVQEDQEERLQDLIDAMVEGTAISALGGEGLVGGEARRIYSGIQRGQTATELGISQEDYARFQRAAGVNDFIFQNVGGGARITPIHSQDQFVGMKPGGPVDAAMGNKGGGGNGNVTININGGNTSEIMRVMNQVLDRKGIYPSRPHRGK
jgi:hypothetical protein